MLQNAAASHDIQILTQASSLSRKSACCQVRNQEHRSGWAQAQKGIIEKYETLVIEYNEQKIKEYIYIYVCIYI